MRKKIYFAIAAFLLFAATALAWTPPGDIDLRNYYDLINAMYINATNITAKDYFIGNGSQLTDITASNTDTLDNFDSTFFYGLNKTIVNGTNAADNVNITFGTDQDVMMYYNGSHFIIQST